MHGNNGTQSRNKLIFHKKLIKNIDHNDSRTSTQPCDDIITMCRFAVGGGTLSKDSMGSVDRPCDDEVFVGPVTQRELIITWRKRRQERLEREQNEALKNEDNGAQSNIIVEPVAKKLHLPLEEPEMQMEVTVNVHPPEKTLNSCQTALQENHSADSKMRKTWIDEECVEVSGITVVCKNRKKSLDVLKDEDDSVSETSENYEDALEESVQINADYQKSREPSMEASFTDSSLNPNSEAQETASISGLASIESVLLKLEVPESSVEGSMGKSEDSTIMDSVQNITTKKPASLPNQENESPEAHETESESELASMGIVGHESVCLVEEQKYATKDKTGKAGDKLVEASSKETILSKEELSTSNVYTEIHDRVVEKVAEQQASLETSASQLECGSDQEVETSIDDKSKLYKMPVGGHEHLNDVTASPAETSFGIVDISINRVLNEDKENRPSIPSDTPPVKSDVTPAKIAVTVSPETNPALQSPTTSKSNIPKPLILRPSKLSRSALNITSANGVNTNKSIEPVGHAMECEVMEAFELPTAVKSEDALSYELLNNGIDSPAQKSFLKGNVSTGHVADVDYEPPIKIEDPPAKIVETKISGAMVMCNNHKKSLDVLKDKDDSVCETFENYEDALEESVQINADYRKSQEPSVEASFIDSNPNREVQEETASISGLAYIDPVHLKPCTLLEEPESSAEDNVGKSEDSTVMDSDQNTVKKPVSLPNQGNESIEAQETEYESELASMGIVGHESVCLVEEPKCAVTDNTGKSEDKLGLEHLNDATASPAETVFGIVDISINHAPDEDKENRPTLSSDTLPIKTDVTPTKIAVTVTPGTNPAVQTPTASKSNIPKPSIFKPSKLSHSTLNITSANGINTNKSIEPVGHAMECEIMEAFELPAAVKSEDALSYELLNKGINSPAQKSFFKGNVSTGHVADVDNENGSPPIKTENPPARIVETKSTELIPAVQGQATSKSSIPKPLLILKPPTLNVDQSTLNTSWVKRINMSKIPKPKRPHYIQAPEK